jgi:hypothetical protein
MIDKPELYTPDTPERSSRDALEQQFGSGDPDRIYHAFLGAAYFEDAAWVQTRCFGALSSPLTLICCGALEALQILVAVRGEFDRVPVITAVTPLLTSSDPAVVRAARDVLDDIRNIYGP